MRRLTALAGLVATVAFEAAAWLALRAAGEIERYQVDWAHFARWADQVPTADLVVGVGRVVVMVIVGWLAITTSLYVLASFTRVRALISLTGFFTPGRVKRLAERAAVVGLSLGVVAPSATAFAQEPAGGWAKAPTAVTATVLVTAVDTPTAVDPVVIPAAVAPTAELAGRWVVAKGDNFWGIAAATIAQTTGRDVEDVPDEEITPYWRQLVDEAMESGAVSSGDPNLIFPGEVEALPVFAAVTDVAPPAITTPVTTPELAPGSSSSPPSPTEHLPAPATTVATVPTTVATTPDTPDTVAPATTQPVDLLQAPPAAPAPAKLSTPAAAQAEENRVSGVFTWGAGGIVAAGVLLELGRRRRRGSRRRRPGEVLVPAASREAVAAEGAVRRAADLDGVVFVDAALRALSAAVSDWDETPEPIGFILNDEHLDVVLAEPAVAPPPFRGRGTHWTLSRAVDLDDLDSTGMMPMPSVVTLGSNPDGAQVVVDLEYAMMLSLAGAGGRELVNAAALQLATAPWSTVASVILVGFPPMGGATVRSVETLAEVIDDLEDQGRETAKALKLAGGGTTIEHRLRGTLDHVPTVVVCATPPPSDLARRLVTLVRKAGAGVSALVAGSMPDSPWEVDVGAGITLEDFGTTVVVVNEVSTGRAADIAELLDAAAQAPVPTPPPPRALEPTLSTKPVIVSLYGPITVEGIPEPESPDKALEARGKSKEALVYLASNRDRAIDGDRLRTALSPDGGTGHTLNNTISHMRQAVGRHHVPPTERRLYRLCDVVTTLQLIEAALHDTETLPPEVAMPELRKALEWVRGRPFDMPVGAGFGGGKVRTAYEWALEEGHVSHAEQVAGDAAHRLFSLAFEAGDLGTADWAIRQGRRADPENEQLRSDEIRLAGVRRDAQAMDTVMTEVTAAAAADDDTPAAETLEVYRTVRGAIEDDDLVGVGG